MTLAGVFEEQKAKSSSAASDNDGRCIDFRSENISSKLQQFYNVPQMKVSKKKSIWHFCYESFSHPMRKFYISSADIGYTKAAVVHVFKGRKKSGILEKSKI